MTELHPSVAICAQTSTAIWNKQARAKRAEEERKVREDARFMRVESGSL
jgi:hypothetical protein